MTTNKINHKKLSMKRVFKNTKTVGNSSIEILKSMMPKEDAMIANYMGAVKKNKKTTRKRKA